MSTHAWSPLLRSAALGVLAWALFAPEAIASPPAGSDAPVIALKDLSDTAVSTASLSPRTLVLIFGELTHERAKTACADVLDVLADPRLSGAGVVPVLIIAQDAPLAQLRDLASQGRFPAIILHDPKRDAFGAYHVLVVPTVVVVDPQGKVVHAMPGFLQRSKDILAESILVAIGKESKEQLEQTIDPKAQEGLHEGVRADRLAHLGAELTRHGLYELAEARYAEATKLVPGHMGATLGLGDLMLRQGRIDDAEPLFRSALAAHPDSVDAALGIAAVQIRRAGEELPKAEVSLRAILDKDPQQARAWFLMGQVHEKKNDLAAAMADYRKSAELALDR